MVEKYAYVYEYENRKVIGITFFEKYDYQMPLATNFNARASESGSSGGLMLSLMMYDQLIPEDLTRGKTVVGTGTIDKDGNVGAIGGIKYKMLGARKKADVFLVPEANCEDAQNIYNTFEMNFTMACVKTFDEAIDFLNGI